jgi:hypothetical protein
MSVHVDGQSLSPFLPVVPLSLRGRANVWHVSFGKGVRGGSGVPVSAGDVERKPWGGLGLQDIYSTAGALRTLLF